MACGLPVPNALWAFHPLCLCRRLRYSGSASGPQGSTPFLVLTFFLDCLFPAAGRPLGGPFLRERTSREHCLRHCDPRLHSHGCRHAATNLFQDGSGPASVMKKGASSRTHVQCYERSHFPGIVRCCLGVSTTTVGMRAGALRRLFCGSCFAGWACHLKFFARTHWRAQTKDSQAEFLRLVRCCVGGMGTCQGRLSPQGPHV